MYQSIPRDGSVDTRAPVSDRSSQIDRWAERRTDRGRPFSESYSSEGVLRGTPGSFQDEVHVGTTGPGRPDHQRRGRARSPSCSDSAARSMCRCSKHERRRGTERTHGTIRRRHNRWKIGSPKDTDLERNSLRGPRIKHLGDWFAIESGARSRLRTLSVLTACEYRSCLCTAEIPAPTVRAGAVLAGTRCYTRYGDLGTVRGKAR